MKITLLTYGSRGDIQPFLALAIALQRAGHIVTLAGPSSFSDFVHHMSADIFFSPLAGDPAELSKSINAAGTNVYRMIHSIKKYIIGIAPQVVRQIVDVTSDADLLVHSFLFTTGGHSLARHLGIPDVSIQVFPMFAPTGDFPNVALPSLGRAGNYLSHWLATQIFWVGGNTGFRQIQYVLPDTFPRMLSWPFREPHPTPLLLACSPSVVPSSPDWHPNVHVTGYFFLENEKYHPPDVLSRFLQAGEPPLCVTFGSMINKRSQQIHQMIVDVINTCQGRAILLTGWSKFKPVSQSENILILDEAPHEWLFPRCKAVIHHGGAGTTAAGLRAGIPSIILPHAADQPFWGARVYALSAGSRPIPVRKLSHSHLMQALKEIDDPVIINPAQVIGSKICAERGLETAIELIEREKARFTLKNRKL